MSRHSRFLSGVSASYIGVVANIFYALALVPIGLRYLGADQFGLWMLLTQVSGYLGLIELGVFGSATRILIDYKDNKDSDAYSSIVVTSAVILAAQGVIIAVACWFAAPLIVYAFNVPVALQELAIYLLKFMGLTLGLATCMKIFSAILYANQRIDLVVLFQAMSPLLSLAIIWPLLAYGFGLASLPWSFLPPVVLLSTVSWYACQRLGFLPAKIRLTNFRFSKVRELFQLGADFFLINIGTQLLEASQLMIVSRTMGLTAAAIWSVSTKLFNLLFQLIAKIENTAIVFFSEMIVRGEREKLQSSFRQMYQLTGGIAVCGMIGAAAINPYFVQAWAGSGVLWPSINNWLLAILLIFNLLLRCHTDFAMHTKKVGLLRFIFFFESLAFVVLALWAAPRFGFAGILVASISCALLFRASYAIQRTSTYFHVPVQEVGFRWITFLAWPTIAMVFVAFLIATFVASLPLSPILQVVISGFIAGLASLTILGTFGLPVTVRKLIAERFSKFYQHYFPKLGH